MPPATRCISGCFFLGAAEAAAGAVLDLSSAFDADVDVMVDVQMNRLGSDDKKQPDDRTGSKKEVARWIDRRRIRMQLACAFLMAPNDAFVRS